MIVFQVNIQTILLPLLAVVVSSANFLPLYDKSKPVKNTVFVMGAEGLVGKATVSALVSHYGNSIDIKAGVADPGKAKSFKGVRVVRAEFGNRERLRAVFKCVHSLFLTSPRAENRVELVIETAKAAKEAGVKYILLYSLVVAEDSNIILGAQYSAIEKGLSSLGVPFTVLRLSIFMENLMAFLPSIKTDSKISWPVDPTKQFTVVTKADAALAAATVLASPGKHIGKTYTIVSDRITFGKVTEEFSVVLHESIKYERTSYPDAIIFLKQHGFSKWYAEGIMELYQLVDEDSWITNPEKVNDFEKITGQKPTVLSQWIAKLSKLLNA